MWNEKFSAEDYLYGTQPNDFLKAMSSLLPQTSKVLCIGEGEGRNAVYLATLGHQVTAVDASEVGLSKAQKLAQQKNTTIETLVCDLSDFDFGVEQWDAIISIFCHLPEQLRQKVHGQIPTGLKPGGFVIIEGYHPKQLSFNTGGPKNLEFLMSAQQLKTELETLEWQHLTELERNIIEGSGHTGPGYVTQAVGQKRHPKAIS